VEFPTRLTDGVVVLRPLEERDRDDVLETMRDRVVARWLNMPERPADGDFEEVLRGVREGRESRERLDLAITVAGEDRAVGGVIASLRPRGNWELAYLAGPHGRGRGLVTRGVRLVVGWLVDQGVGRIEVRTLPENGASQRVAERCGFVREGRERRSVWLRGERRDALVYSLLPDDPRPR
jgi:RimJ/RimL family protein N-acetyltransferase